MSNDIDPGIDGLTQFRRIGSGGFSTVYIAWEAEFSRWVAVKILHDLDEAAARHFDRERRLMGQSSGHPNVITPIRSGLTVDGKPYLVMQYMEGGSLQDLTDRGELLPWRDAVALVRPIADALGDSHQRGILHKDVKPANILLARNGSPSLTDFGIAGILGSTVTQMAFTFAHTPPETFASGTDNRDERSDLYSLASTLYTIIAGRSPFEQDGDDSQLAWINRIANHPVPRLGVDDHLDQFLASALAKDPAQRPQNARQFIDGLDRVLAGTGSVGGTGESSATGTGGLTQAGLDSARTITEPGQLREHRGDRRPGPDTRRRRSDAVGWAVALVAVVGVGAAAWFAFGREPNDEGVSAATDTTIDEAGGPTTLTPSTTAGGDEPEGGDGGDGAAATALPAEVQAAKLLLQNPDSDLSTVVVHGLLPDTDLSERAFTYRDCETQLQAMQTSFGGVDLPQLREEIAEFPAGSPEGYVDPAGQDRGFRERLAAYVDQTETGYRLCSAQAQIAPVGTHVLSGWASIRSFLCVTGVATEVTLADGSTHPCPVADELGLCSQILAPLLDDFFQAFPDSNPGATPACQAAVEDDPTLYPDQS